MLIPIGLGTKIYQGPLQDWVHGYAGDVCSAAFFYFLLRLLWKHGRPVYSALIVLMLCALVEFSQSSQAAWLTALRRAWFGRFVLGARFDWLDLLYYGLGLVLALGLEAVITRRKATT